MRYYLVDDNIAAVKVLQNIIRVRELGEVAGTSTDPETAASSRRSRRARRTPTLS